MVERHLRDDGGDGKVGVFDPQMLEGAISSIVLAFVEEQSTLDEAAQSDFVRDIVRGLPPDYAQSMLKKVRDVGVPEIKQVLKDIVWGLFEPGKADVLVTCAPGLAEVRCFLLFSCSPLLR